MAIQSPPYMRDFYPEELALRAYISDVWRRESERCGFVEYDGPIFEFGELYELKSGEGILSELFSFEDRGGRKLALRPEMTPTLARMVNARVNSLKRPIKWFSIPNCCRAERGQKGRLREFWQWNVDVLAAEGEGAVALADAECIAVCIQALRRFGLTSEHVRVHISHRALMTELLRSRGIDSDAAIAIAFNLIDRVPKLSPEALQQYARDRGLSDEQFAAVVDLIHQPVTAALGTTVEAAVPHAEHVRQVLSHLDAMGLADYVKVDLHIARGLAYYTGVIFEVLDLGGEHRAIAGGGRYDNLIGLLGGPPVSGIGFGMGDVVIGDLLAQHGLLEGKAQVPAPEYFVLPSSESPGLPAVLAVTQRLRDAGRSADFGYRQQNIGKALKTAVSREAKFALLIDQAYVEHEQVHIKDLASGEQRTVKLAELLAPLVLVR